MDAFRRLIRFSMMIQRRLEEVDMFFERMCQIRGAMLGRIAVRERGMRRAERVRKLLSGCAFSIGVVVVKFIL